MAMTVVTFRRFICLAFLLMPLCGMAQMQRKFPQNALRGELTVIAAPEIRLNGRPARLAPAARIRNQNNLIELSARLTDERLKVNYTFDIDGNVHDVWILRPDEIANRPWPKNANEAARWTFDPIAQTWTKP